MDTDGAAADAPSRRIYRSTLRTEQARQTRRRLLTAAARCFAEKGYAGTTLKDIATAAGVSVETVQLNGPKAALLMASYEQSFAGDEGQHSLLQREALRDVWLDDSPSRIVHRLVDFMVVANGNSAGVAFAVEAAVAADPGVAASFAGLRERALTDARTGVEYLASLTRLPSPRPIDEIAVEVWFACSSHHYKTLVTDIGWTIAQYRDWLLRTLAGLLLSP